MARAARIVAGAIAVATAGVLAAAVAGCTPIPPDNDPFTTAERGDVGLPVLSLNWRFALADRIGETKPQEFASPILHQDRLFVGSARGTFYSLRALDGAVDWRIELGAVSSRPLLDGDDLYIGTDDGSMVCLSALDGREKWRYSTRGPVMQPPVLMGDLLFFSNENDRVIALDVTQKGKFRWQYKTESPEEYTLRGHAGVVIAPEDGLVFSGFSNGTMVALRTNTGSVAWLTSLKGDADRFVDVDGTPVVAGDTVYVTSSSGGVYALDKATGLVRWRLPMEGAGGLVVDGRRIYVAAAESGIYALDLAGHVVWRQGTRAGGEPAEPIVSGDYLIYSLTEEGMFIADKDSGVVHQFFNPGDGVSATPAVIGDRLYVLSNRGVLYAMSMARF